MNTKDKKGYSDRLKFEHDLLEEHTENSLPLNVDMREDNIKFSPNHYNKHYQLSEIFDETARLENKRREKGDFSVFDLLNEHKMAEMRRWPKINARDEFLKGYDSVDEEVTITIMEHLHRNPHLFRKIRFLQRKNKALNIDDVPELDKLKKIKRDVVRLTI